MPTFFEDNAGASYEQLDPMFFTRKYGSKFLNRNIEISPTKTIMLKNGRPAQLASLRLFHL